MRIAECLVLCAIVSGCDGVLPGAGADTVTNRAKAPGVTAARTEPKLLTPTDPAGSILDFGSLQGRWTVTGVALADGPVQAYVADDPAFMGRAVIIAGNSIRWQNRGAEPAAARDDAHCAGAATMRLPIAAAEQAIARRAKALQALGISQPTPQTAAPHEIACLAGGQWGPPTGALLFPVDQHSMIMTWYDNVVLKLQWK